ncbi:hypothetical protein BC835DRAFT_1302525 [Cytidiella melzeri]|nr:hypothetical protein BC835DRAFT_1302525 [Cytidiella melzeri]
MDVSALRAEIKAWERDFKTTCGRDPTVQDIKDQPDMADKYKLYKKLSKQLHASSSASTSAKPVPEDHRRTPPRDPHRSSTSSLLLSTPKHRAVRTAASSLSGNPFSPVKHKAKGKRGGLHDPSADSDLKAIPHLSSGERTKANPFVTPSKPRHRATTSRNVPPPVLEEDPFPLIDSHTLASSSKPPISDASRKDGDGLDISLPRTDQPNGKPVEDAVTRARKRLRGEPVSPSPVKEKRARTTVERVDSSAFDRGSLFDTLQAARAEDSDEESTRRVSEDEFIGETPVKPMKGGKAFVKLFDEAIPAPAYPQNRPKASKSELKTKAGSLSLLAFGFGLQGLSKSKGKQRALSPPEAADEDDMDVDGDEHVLQTHGNKLRAPNFRGSVMKPTENFAKPATKNGKSLAKAVFPGRSNLFDDSSSASSVAERVGKLASIKKDASVVVEGDESSSSQHFPPSSLPLLPPSPPPTSANSSKYTGDKGKASAKGLARKKAKLLEQMVAGDDPSGGETDGLFDEDEEVKVKEVSWTSNARLQRNRRDASGGVLDEDVFADSEPEFGTTMYRPAPMSSAEAELEKFEVNLPDHLRKVLAISPHETKDDEDRLARGLIYGRREGHYDSARGGEIWGAGEVTDVDTEPELSFVSHIKLRTKASEEDDDWEGEPVPWEVGEL